jgi:glycosyltransferase involved in cell wall biosynthesis
MKKPRIFLITTSAKISGAEKNILPLVKINEFDFFVCTLKSEKEGLLLRKARELGAETVDLGINFKWEIWKLIKLFFVLKKTKPDIIQSFLFFDNIIARIIGKIAGVPVIISGIRNVQVDRSKFRNFIEKNTVGLADYIVSNSEAGKKLMIEREKFPEGEIKVIYNGVNTESFCSENNLNLINLIGRNAAKASPVIGYVGRVIKQKGLDYLIKSFVEIKRDFKNSILIIIGDGEDKKEFEKLSKKLKVKNDVYFTGRKEKAWRYMKLFDVFILPSFSEGFPNVIMEAMACGTPVIATNVGGISELVKNNQNGFLVDPRNEKTLTDKINYVLNLPLEEKKEIIRNAQENIRKNFSVEKMVREYQLLYEKILKEK